LKDNPVATIYEKLLERYGELGWWPAETPYEVIVGAVLTQNTAWTNVEKAIANFEGELSPARVLETGHEELAGIIRPAGYFNQKAVYLKTVTEWFERYGFDVSAARREPPEKLRAELLATKGVGPETADSILLYAFGLPTFVVDAYTVRLCGRYPLEADMGYTGNKSYEAVKSYFESRLPRDAGVYSNLHAMIVFNAKDHCRKKPLCGGCPLGSDCGKVMDR